MNLADADIVHELMENKGYERSDDPDSADLMFVNTCTVRQHAEDKALSHIGRCRTWKRKKDGRRLVIMGCVVERMGKTLKAKFPCIDLLIGSKEVHNLPALLDQFSIISPNASSHGSPWITIMRGCNNYCSYCIVPHVRGRESSIPLDKIIDAVHRSVRSGIHAITLLGQNINSYVHNGINFAELLDQIASINGVSALSFMTSHPKDFTDDIIAVVKEHANIHRIIHLPVQSGSNRILRLMKRGYTLEEYLSLIERVKSMVEGLYISTDIIAGFPGEEENDFKETMDLIDTADFYSAYVYKYSPRAGTAAAELTDSVPTEVKERRHAEILNKLKRRVHVRAA